MADASHEMRTPLAVMRANIELVLGHGNESVMDNMEWLLNVHSEITRLGKLTDDLLTLARVDSNQTQVLIEEVDFLDLVQDVCESFAILAEAKGIQLSAVIETRSRYINTAEQPSEDIETFEQPLGGKHPSGHSYGIRGDVTRLRQLVTILVDNGLKYTPTGGSVRVVVSQRWHVVRLRVSDTGIGIKPTEIDRVFDRFYRGDEARNRASGGTGLGLSIAQWITTMHKGKISVKSAPGEGTVFTVALPVN